MLKELTLYAALLTLAAVGSAVGQPKERANEIPMPPVIEAPQEQIEKASAVKNWGSATAKFQPDSPGAMQSYLTEIVTWLSTNFDLPAIHDHPRVKFVPEVNLAAVRYKGFLPDPWRETSVNNPAAQVAQRRAVVAIYNDTTKTIFIADPWTGRTTAELSVLVHEMVHHLQNLAGLKYACPQERERFAYEAQERWLGLFGRDLLQDFEIDPFTLVVSTMCPN